MKDYYFHLFEYNDWANRLVLDKLNEYSNLNPKIYSLYSHIIIAQILWLNRVREEPNEFKDFWQLLDLDSIKRLNAKSTADWLSLLNGIDEKNLEQSHSYVNSKGNKYSNTLAQILTHVINHSTYHRAQIAQLLRAENIQPPYTDYIGFFR